MSMSDPITMKSTKAEILDAYTDANSRAKTSATDAREKHRPIQRMDVARLVACSSAVNVADWVIGRLVPLAIRGDLNARDTIAALKLYRQAGPFADDAASTEETEP